MPDDQPMPRAKLDTGRAGGAEPAQILVSYGTGEWYVSQLRLEASARRVGFTELQTWRRRDLVKTSFYRRHRAVLDAARGGGYWLWKPYFILRALEEAEPGDAVVYADAGLAFTDDPTPLISRCRREGGVLLFAGHYEGDRGPGPAINSRWTKRDCFVRMGADEPSFHGACQADASLLVLIRNDRSLAFAREFLHYCEDPAILTDAPLACGHPSLPDFVAHRHDQSVLSLLAVKHDIPLHRHPSQHGNHLKQPAQRTPGEWLRQPYADSPWPDRYGTLADHHRERSDRQTLAQAADVQGAFEQNRAALRNVRSWVSDDTFERSVDGYGIPLSRRHLVDGDVGDDATFSDLLVHYARRLVQPVSYLELGVSVGKNFQQVLCALESSDLVGFDLEDVSPALRAQLGDRPARVDTWPTLAGSLREAPSTQDRYAATPGGSQVDFLSADIWDRSAWARLEGRRFNLLLSGATHSPELIRYEGSMLERHELIDSRGFVLMWPDLGGAKTDAFLEIWERLRDRLALPNESLELGLAAGSFGASEPPQLVGLIIKPDTASPSDSASLPTNGVAKERAEQDRDARHQEQIQ